MTTTSASITTSTSSVSCHRKVMVSAFHVALCLLFFQQSHNEDAAGMVAHAFDVSPPHHPHARRYSNDQWRSPQPSDTYTTRTSSPPRTPEKPNPPGGGAGLGGINPVKSIWETTAPVLVEGSSLQTWAFEKVDVQRVQVLLKAPPRNQFSFRSSSSSPSLVFQASVDVWHGPDNTPQRMVIYMEDHDHIEDDDGFETTADAASTPFSAIIETPGGYNTIAIRNMADTMDHPVLACVEADHHSTEDEDGDDDSQTAYYYNSQRRTATPHGGHTHHQEHPSPGRVAAGSALQAVTERLLATSVPHQVDGGGDASAFTFELAPNIASVQVLLSTDYQRPLQARIELALIQEGGGEDEGFGGGGWDGEASGRTRPPTVNAPPRILKRSIVEVFSEDAVDRPFFAVLETPRSHLLDVREDRHPLHDRRPNLKVQMRVLNLSPPFDGFPLYACVEPYVIDAETTTATGGPRGRAAPNASSRPPTNDWEGHYRDPSSNVDQEILMDEDATMNTHESNRHHHHHRFGRCNGKYNATVVDVELA